MARRDSQRQLRIRNLHSELKTGIDRNPADQVEVEHVDDTRKRYLSEEELPRLMVALDERMYRKGTKDINKTNLRLRLLVLIAVATGMRRGRSFASSGETFSTTRD